MSDGLSSALASFLKVLATQGNKVIVQTFASISATRTAMNRALAPVGREVATIRPVSKAAAARALPRSSKVPVGGRIVQVVTRAARK